MYEDFFELLKEYRKENNCFSKIFNNDSNICYVFLSSQGIYKEAWNASQMKGSFENNRYEWQNIANNKKLLKNAKKYIFIRDIGKELYQHGINSDMDSIDKIVSFVKRETKGMNVFLVGSSSGGYLAFILSQLTNVRRVYSFGGLVSLENKSTYHEVKERYAVDEKYASVERYIGKQCVIIHSFGIQSNEDLFNYNILKANNSNQCIFIPFKAREHAPRPYADDIIKMLCFSDSQLNRLKHKLAGRTAINQFRFSLICGGGLTIFKRLI